MCREDAVTRVSFSAPRAVNELRCELAVEQDYFSCMLDGQGAARPSDSGPDLFCSAPRGGLFDCHLDGTME